MSNIVKIDEELKKRIEEFIKKGENRFDFPSLKNFVDKAVFKLLANYMDGIKDIESLHSSDLLVPYNNSWKPSPTPAQKIVSKRKPK